jgi:CheY-like chemotaxis protein
MTNSRRQPPGFPLSLPDRALGVEPGDGMGWGAGTMSEGRCGRRILVAEDHLGVREVMSRFLRFEGYEVYEARDGLDVLYRLARDEVPDLILLDLSMPYLDGMMVMKSIRRHHPRLPVVLVTAAMCSLDFARELGASGYLPKPFTTSELLTSIEGSLGTGTPGNRRERY